MSHSVLILLACLTSGSIADKVKSWLMEVCMYVALSFFLHVTKLVSEPRNKWCTVRSHEN